MEIIRTDSPHDSYYTFFKTNFPWDWGSYEKFIWKHLQDPFLGKNDFYILEQDKCIRSICVARKYTYLYRNQAFNILSMMDFVTALPFRRTGKLTYLLQYIYKNIGFDYSIGFSSYQLRETIHRETSCAQIYYTYLLPPSTSPLASASCNDDEAISALNANENSFQILRTKKYLAYIKKNPSYRKLVFLKLNSFVIGVAFEINKENSVRIVEMSDYSMKSCMIAYRMASVFGKTIKIDLPQKIEEGHFLRETCFDVFSKNSDYNIFYKGDLIWVPLSDRK